MLNIFAIVVTYKGKQWYDRCLGSLVSSKENVNIIVIDNASNDGSAEYIKTKFPEVHLIESDVNLGFAKANNIGMRYALDHGADYVFLLNQDAWVETDTLTELLHTFADNKDVGVASPVHVNGTYTALDKNFAGYMGWQFASDAFMKKMQHYYERPFVNAAAWLISAECIKRVGGFDTLLFKHYGEDNNYLQRVSFHGMKLIVNTQCSVCHDREKRQVEPMKAQFNTNAQYYAWKLTKGNIMMPFSPDVEINAKQRALTKAYIGVHPKRIKRLKYELQLLRDIQISRTKNQQGGKIWL